MAGITPAMTNSFRTELFSATHNFNAAGGNTFKLALFKVGIAGTYGKATTNYSDMTGNSDEVANGSGYTTGGVTLATNINPANGSNIAFTQWTTNPNWTSATFSCIGCMIYNSSASNKATSVYDFGGTQTVTAGTLTLVQPSNGGGTSLLNLA